jgi:hypothetical protein
MKIYCYEPRKEKNILAGEIKICNDGYKYFYKKVLPIHFMIVEHGYGIQEEVLQRLVQEKVERIIIKTNTSEIVSKLEDWLNRPIKNYGHGAQRFLGGK